jgi:hypothetical protein
VGGGVVGVLVQWAQRHLPHRKPGMAQDLVHLQPAWSADGGGVVLVVG